MGLTNLLEACCYHNVKRFVFISSSPIYGNKKKVPFSEKDVINYPILPYVTAIPMYENETIAREYTYVTDIVNVAVKELNYV